MAGQYNALQQTPKNVSKLSVNKFQESVKKRLCEDVYYTERFSDDNAEWVQCDYYRVFITFL